MFVRKTSAVGLLLLFFLFKAVAQPAQFAFRVFLKDKNGSPSLANASQFLSQRSLDRRTKFNISLDSTDRPVSSIYVNDVLSTTGGKLHVVSKWFNHCVILLEDSSKILLLQGKSYIDSITLVGHYTNGLHRAAGKFANEHSVPLSITQNLRTTGSSAYYGQSFTQVNMVHGDTLHDLGYKGQGVIIAVLDAGFEAFDTHHGFDSVRAQGRLIDTHDFVLAKELLYQYSNHGMQAVSTIAGNIPGSYIGTAPLASFALYRTEDETHFEDMPIEIDNLIAGSERADSLGADVITESLGYNTFNYPGGVDITNAQMDGKTTIGTRAANMAVQKGIFFTASAGNEGTMGLLVPGDADSTLTIGSVDNTKANAFNSGYGPNAAGIVKPDVCALGNPAKVFGTLGDIFSNSGTSFSTPQMAGWAACLRQAKPNASVYEIRRAIIKSADHYTIPGPQIGYGVPDFRLAAYFLGIVDTAKQQPQPPDTLAFLTVYPTAIKDVNSLHAILHIDEDQQVQFAMFDISGRTLWHSADNYKKGTQTIQIRLPYHLPGGMYFLKVTGSKQHETVKLIKL